MDGVIGYIKPTKLHQPSPQLIALGTGYYTAESIRKRSALGTGYYTAESIRKRSAAYRRGNLGSSDHRELES